MGITLCKINKQRHLLCVEHLKTFFDIGAAQMRLYVINVEQTEFTCYFLSFWVGLFLKFGFLFLVTNVVGKNKADCTWRDKIIRLLYWHIKSLPWGFKFRFNQLCRSFTTAQVNFHKRQSLQIDDDVERTALVLIIQAQGNDENEAACFEFN